MKTILVPVDFTPTSGNAVDYAVEWAGRYQYKRIILLRSFYDSVFDDVVMSTQYGNVSQDYRLQEKESAMLQLLTMKDAIESRAKDLEVLALTSDSPLLRAIMEVAEDEEPDTIVIGSDHEYYDSLSFVSRHVISIAKASPVKLIIVPAGYHYKPVQQALVPCDLSVAGSLHKLQELHPSRLSEGVTFEVVILDQKGQYLNPDEKFRQAEEEFHHYLRGFNHTLHYVQEKNILEGVIKFLKNHPVELIVALPGRYSFLYSLTHKSLSEALCRNVDQPVLILK
jgi:nucleotide-binding universal stress UspA family protein